MTGFSMEKRKPTYDLDGFRQEFSSRRVGVPWGGLVLYVKLTVDELGRLILSMKEK